MKWRIYYEHGRTYDGPEPPVGENARGVQAVVQDHPEVRAEIVTSSDYYVWHQGRWKGVDSNGLFDYLLDSGIVLLGRTITREEYQAIIRRAAADKDTWLPTERKP